MGQTLVLLPVFFFSLRLGEAIYNNVLSVNNRTKRNIYALAYQYAFAYAFLTIGDFNSTSFLQISFIYSLMICVKLISKTDFVLSISQFVNESIEHALNAEYLSLRNGTALIVQSLVLIMFWFGFTYGF